MAEFIWQLKPSFPPLITGHVYENHFRLPSYCKWALIEWIDIEANNANIYNAGIYISDTRWWDINRTGKTIIDFPIGLAYATKADLIVWTKNNIVPNVSIKMNTNISRENLKWLLSRPIDWKIGNKMIRFSTGHLAYLNDDK